MCSGFDVGGRGEGGAGFFDVLRFQCCKVDGGEHTHQQLPRADGEGGVATDEAVKLKTLKRCSISKIFEMKEDVEEEKSSPEIEMVLKHLSFDADKVSITVTKFQWLSKRLEALRSNGISFDLMKFDEGNLNSTDEEKESEMLCLACKVFNTATVTAAKRAHRRFV
ncbi:hypothetical protein GYH30_004710 [Glycine max]|nr:hypothetical protein GYH30_004710 [Glycine max]